MKELREKKIPFTVRRFLPDGRQGSIQFNSQCSVILSPFYFYFYFFDALADLTSRFSLTLDSKVLSMAQFAQHRNLS